jgi:plastocyanin
MKKIINWGLLLTLVLSMLSFAAPAFASTPALTSQNYTVLVGAENTSAGVSLMSFFPATVRVHVGDSVTWKINSHEIHTVTFLAGTTMPDLLIPAPANQYNAILQINPVVAFPVAPAGGQYDGSTYANSGIMTSDPGGFTTFKLTFTTEGSFDYVCVVHGMMMSGTIQVVGQNVAIPTPSQVAIQGQAELKAAWLTVPTVFAKAKAQRTPPVKNPDGTFTYTVYLGYESGNVMIMKFFPGNLTVHPGDTVVWKLSPSGEAPHTVSFFNGTPDQSFAIFDPSIPALLINPAVMFPSQAVMAGIPLNKTDYFNSGILQPTGPTSFSLKVGNISGTLNYECILHDTSGMSASLFVTPR